MLLFITESNKLNCSKCKKIANVSELANYVSFNVEQQLRMISKQLPKLFGNNFRDELLELKLYWTLMKEKKLYIYYISTTSHDYTINKSLPQWQTKFQPAQRVSYNTKCITQWTLSE